MKNKLFCTCIFILGTLSTSAQNSNSKWSIDALWEIAQENSLQLKVLQGQLQQAANEKFLGNAYLLPQIYGNAAANQIWVDDLNRNSPQGLAGQGFLGDYSGPSFSAEVGLQWTLFDGGQMFKARSLVYNGEDLAQTKYKRQKGELYLALSQSYLSLKQAVLAWDISQEKLDRSRVFFKEKQQLKDLGALLDRELMADRLDLLRDSIETIQAKDAFEIANQSFWNLLGKETPVTSLDWIESLRGEDVFLGDVSLKNEFNAISDWNAKQSFTLIEAKEQVEIAEDNYGLARGKLWPSVQAQASYNWSRSERDYSPLGSNETGFLTSRVGLLLQWSIFAGFANEMGRRNSKIDLKNARYSLIDTERNLQREFTEKKLLGHSYLKQISQAQDLVSLAKEQAEISSDLYQNGTLSRLEYRESLLVWQNQSLKLFQIKAQMWILIKELELLQGKNF